MDNSCVDLQYSIVSPGSHVHIKGKVKLAPPLHHKHHYQHGEHGGRIVLVNFIYSVILSEDQSLKKE